MSVLILNVDDNDAIRYARSRILRARNFELKEAADGATALAIARDHRPSLILLDVHLPDMTGFEVCRQIKADPTTASIPVLHLSASSVDQMQRAEGLDCGADGYLVEPVEPELLLATINSMLRMRQAEDAVHELAWQWQTTFDAINDGLATLTADGRILRCNRQFAVLFNQPSGDFKDERVDDLIVQLTGDRIIDLPFRRMLQSHRRESQDVRAGGRWLQITVDPIGGEGRELTGAVYRISDVSDIKHTEETLKRSNEDLQQFAFVASHDLKEPLRMVTSYSQLLAKRYKGCLDKDADDYIGFITDGVSRMATLIDTLLAYSRVVDPPEAPPKNIDCNGILQWALINLQTVINETGAEVTFDPLPIVSGDDNRLVQVFQNLIGNAIKYRREEAPRIHVQARRLYDFWQFSVRDNGIGIDPQYADRIFVLFRRLHGKDVPGAGIGLAICTRIIEAHGGRIWVESTPGAGSTFHFTLPAKGADEI